MARRKLPTVMLHARGSRNVKKRKNEPKLRVIEHADLSIPESLKDDPDAVRFYTDVHHLLTNCRVLSANDLYALETLAHQWGVWNRARAKVMEEGEVYETTNGNQVQSPWLGIMNKASDRLFKGYTHFGLTPSARGGVSVIGGTMTPKGETDGEEDDSKEGQFDVG